MRRFLARLGIRLLVTLCVLVGAACVVGSLRLYPAWSTLEQFLCSPQPCWHGLRLGVTSVPEAASILGADETIELVNYNLANTYVCWVWRNELHRDESSWDGCFSYFPGGTSEIILNYEDSPLRLQDLMHFLRQPAHSVLCTDTRTETNLGVIFSPRARVTVNVPLSSSRVSPDLQVSQIIFFDPVDEDLPKITWKFGWDGYSEWGNTSPNCSG